MRSDAKKNLYRSAIILSVGVNYSMHDDTVGEVIYCSLPAMDLRFSN